MPLKHPARTSWARETALAFLLPAAVIGALWYAAIGTYQKVVLRERARELQAVAELKIGFIEAWLAERRGDAAVQASRPRMALALAPHAGAGAPHRMEELEAQFEDLRRAYGYEAVLLFDRAGRYRFGVGDVAADESLAADTARRTMQQGRVVISRSYPVASGARTRVDIDFAAPVADAAQEGSPIVGALLFHVDPHAHLDALLRRWPAPSASAESFLFEQAGENFVYLTSLRHAAAETVHKTLREPTLPAAMAARGRRGVVEGVDYRGVEVLAAVGHVDDLPWYVVSKMDRDEILAPVRREALWSGALTALLALALGLALLFAGRRRRSELALAQQAAVLAATREQRDTLVREVHHRIKNHLQGLGGLLRQQISQHAELRPLIEESVAQINAIAVVHGLQGRDRGDRVGLRGLVMEIAGFLHGIRGVMITLQADAGQCFRTSSCPLRDACRWAVRAEEAVPLALVLNELFTNALRHGDPAVAPLLEMRCDEAGAQLTLTNRGRLAAGTDFVTGEGLGTGLSLVRSLLPAEGATLSLVNRDDGRVAATLQLQRPTLTDPSAASADALP